ncbi:hypothetical protein [Streptomyces adustus]|uniref:hypothetical protein n=1 Tax=Streptomyces adustus TaxID=1609272 RepID=UPI0037165611
MAGARGSWTGGRLRGGSFLKPHKVARVLLHPAWIPESLDPSVERLKRVRIAAGAVAAVGVYTFVEGGFALTEMMQNTLVAAAVLLFVTPLTVGVMLYVWRRGGTVSQLRPPLMNAFKLLLLFVGSVVATVLLLMGASALSGNLVIIPLGFLALWMIGFVGAGALRVTANFFGTAAVHRALPPLLATVTTWLMAVPDLVTGDLHGLGLRLGVVFILGAPLTVTAVSLLELRRLKRRYGIRLGAHPATLPPTRPAYVPPQGNPYAQGNPYGQANPYGQGNPYPPGSPYPAGNPYGPGSPYGQGNPYPRGNPYAPPPPPPPRQSRNGRNPYGR